MMYTTRNNIRLRVCKECGLPPVLYILSDPNYKRDDEKYLFSCEIHGPSFTTGGYSNSERGARLGWGIYNGCYDYIHDSGGTICPSPSKRIYLEYPIQPNNTPSFCKWCGTKSTGEWNQHQCYGCKKKFDKPPYVQGVPILMRESEVKKRVPKVVVEVPKFCEKCGEKSETTPCDKCKNA